MNHPLPSNPKGLTGFLASHQQCARIHRNTVSVPPTPFPLALRQVIEGGSAKSEETAQGACERLAKAHVSGRRAYASRRLRALFPAGRLPKASGPVRSLEGRPPLAEHEPSRRKATRTQQQQTRATGGAAPIGSQAQSTTATLGTAQRGERKGKMAVSDLHHQPAHARR